MCVCKNGCERALARADAFTPPYSFKCQCMYFSVNLHSFSSSTSIYRYWHTQKKGRVTWHERKVSAETSSALSHFFSRVENRVNRLVLRCWCCRWWWWYPHGTGWYIVVVVSMLSSASARTQTVCVHALCALSITFSALCVLLYSVALPEIYVCVYTRRRFTYTQ